MYEGTRTGRQELMAEILEDVEGALWKQQWIEDTRDVVHTWDGVDLIRTVVAVDPALSSGPGSDETGIVVVGKSASGDGYVLADRSGRLTSGEWADRVVQAYEDFACSEIVFERTAGDLGREVLEGAGVNLPIEEVTAKVGKTARAQPVATLYEKGKVHHISKFMNDFDALGKLEEQLTTWLISKSRRSTTGRTRSSRFRSLATRTSGRRTGSHASCPAAAEATYSRGLLTAQRQRSPASTSSASET
jgi:phage terminase large subunit-like protein